MPGTNTTSTITTTITTLPGINSADIIPSTPLMIKEDFFSKQSSQSQFGRMLFCISDLQKKINLFRRRIDEYSSEFYRGQLTSCMRLNGPLGPLLPISGRSLKATSFVFPSSFLRLSYIPGSSKYEGTS